MATNVQPKQIGGVFIDPGIYDKFKNIAKAKDGLKPSAKITELIKQYVSENENFDPEWLTKKQFIDAIVKKKIFASSKGRRSIEWILSKIHFEFPEDSIRGGDGEIVFYHNEKAMEFLQNKYPKEGKK